MGSARSAPYPRLAPELRALRGDARRLWGDAEARGQALEAIVRAWEAGDVAALHAAATRIDRSISAALRALGLPRGPVSELVVDLFGRGWLGRKHSDCRLMFDGALLQQAVRTLDQPDEVVRVWVHESLHARGPIAPDAHLEQRQTPGYEEGLVEGLARFVAVEKASMNVLASSYDYYVRAYRALASILDCSAEALWRALWASPPGAVRMRFGSVVDRYWVLKTGQHLSAKQHARLSGLADTIFAVRRVRAVVGDDRALSATWEAALR